MLPMNSKKPPNSGPEFQIEIEYRFWMTLCKLNIYKPVTLLPFEYWTNLVFGSPLYCYLQDSRNNDYFGSRFTWAVRGLFEAELLLSIRVGSRVTNTQMPEIKNTFF